MGNPANVFIDTHCHLCPGLDDGPKSMDEVFTMAHIAWNEGIRAIAALAHQNEVWPDVTPKRIIDSVAAVSRALSEINCDIELVPTAEVMIDGSTIERWDAGELLSYGDQKRFLLIEFPHGLCLDIRDLVVDLVQRGVHPVLAHVDKYPDLLYGGDQIVELIRLGCIVQISTNSLIAPQNRTQMKALRDWAQRGIIHVVGSDAHSPRRRRPQMAAAHEQLRRWTSVEVATQICRDNGVAILSGRALHLPLPRAAKRKAWFHLGER